MAFIGLKVPAEIVSILDKWAVPGERTPHDEYHVTVLFLGDSVPITEVGRAALVAYSVASKVAPFVCSLGGYTTFPPDPKGRTPVIAPVASSGLHAVHAQLKAAFDAAGIEYSKRFPEYKPHTTLSYADGEVPDGPSRGPLVWTAPDLVLWGGDDGEDRIVVKFPFGSAPSDPKMAARIAATYQHRTHLLRHRAKAPAVR